MLSQIPSYRRRQGREYQQNGPIENFGVRLNHHLGPYCELK